MVTLKTASLDPWLDKECLGPGADWENEIRNVRENCKYFIALLSSQSIVNRRSFGKELKDAVWKNLEKIQRGNDVYLIPIRPNDCEVPDFQNLKKIYYIDLFPDWNKGLQRIVQTMKS